MTGKGYVIIMIHCTIVVKAPGRTAGDSGFPLGRTFFDMPPAASSSWYE